jgi:hypothetical protein
MSLNRVLEAGEQMTINLQALREARNALTADLGSLDNLSPDARNTLADIYYRFHLVSVSAKAGDPAAALDL